MGHTNDRSTKASSLVNPTSLNLQPRPFAPLESDEKDEAISHKSGYSENFLEKIINTPRSESATPIQRKPENRLKAIATERNNASLQNQSIQRQEAAEDEKSEGEQEGGKEFIMNPEPPPVQRKFENRLRAKNAQRMAIQTKLAIGEPNDKYEQEADATAARVVQQINSPITTQSQPVQRKFENRLRAKNAQKMALQAKLAIGEPNDKYEQEADATAARVVQQINSSIPSQSLPIQRQEMEEDEELQMKPLVQRSENIGGGEASTDLESAIQSARGSGQSLDANLQQSMGQAMGADFSGVKVHTDSQSDQLNKSIQAKAFTTGQDLFFRQGAYEPSSRGGQELIAHELTHVVQQNVGEKNIVQRKYNKENLKTTIKEVYDSIGKAATEKDFVQALKKFVKESEETPEEIFGDSEFAWQLMELVGYESGMKLHENIKESSKNKGKPISYKNTPVFKGNWTLRTYTTSKDRDGNVVTPPYNDLKPTAELLVSGIKEKSDNTNDADWNKIGNVGFTFHLLCIDGKVPKRTFLDKCTHYAEFPMQSIPSMFVSGDMLGTTGTVEESKHGGFKGSGEDVKAALCNLTLDKSDAVKFLSGIDSLFGNFEVKVPGQLKVIEWKAK